MLKTILNYTTTQQHETLLSNCSDFPSSGPIRTWCGERCFPTRSGCIDINRQERGPAWISFICLMPWNNFSNKKNQFYHGRGWETSQGVRQHWLLLDLVGRGNLWYRNMKRTLGKRLLLSSGNNYFCYWYLLLGNQQTMSFCHPAYNEEKQVDLS